MIDLHCHSSFSDGSLSPNELAKKAQEAGVQLLALTDHDTVDGSRLLLETQHAGLKIISGIEFSTQWKKHDIHILGFNMDLDNPGLKATINQQRSSRISRAQKIAEALALLGIQHPWTKVSELAGHDSVGRPHFAQLLVNEGKAVDRQAAFKRFLGRGKPAYVPTPWISLEQAVAAINQAGGQAVIAHPLKYKLTRTKLQQLILDFKEAGGCGIEAVSGEMTTKGIQEVVGLSLRYQLLVSSGSDYHGDRVSRISLGRQSQLPVNCRPIWHQWTI